MRLQNNQLHDIATSLYFKEYLTLLKERQSRKHSAYLNHMDGYILPNKVLEADIRKNLESQNLPTQSRARLSNLLETQNFIAENDINIQNYKNALDRRLSFNWPDQNEINLRSNEETNFSDFVASNPRTQNNYSPSRTENSEFSVLIGF